MPIAAVEPVSKVLTGSQSFEGDQADQCNCSKGLRAYNHMARSLFKQAEEVGLQTQEIAIGGLMLTKDLAMYQGTISRVEISVLNNRVEMLGELAPARSEAKMKLMVNGTNCAGKQQLIRIFSSFQPRMDNVEDLELANWSLRLGDLFELQQRIISKWKLRFDNHGVIDERRRTANDCEEEDLLILGVYLIYGFGHLIFIIAKSTINQIARLLHLKLAIDSGFSTSSTSNTKDF
ncbi:hypothetical protein PPACK8108_LOCUS19898 [Phakopsora pachyrhizi]|uniref:Uncharacterized protein n=1 Tax=Phakopsora pachyrhizi TaxID=170000 RepID=A0AAV0BDX6_PHAPC|nr:hypothetical protein PPACK8108_LOCUS19898 [Phakopsora pachyrhizi]